MPQVLFNRRHRGSISSACSQVAVESRLNCTSSTRPHRQPPVCPQPRRYCARHPRSGRRYAKPCGSRLRAGLLGRVPPYHVQPTSDPVSATAQAVRVHQLRLAYRDPCRSVRPLWSHVRLRNPFLALLPRKISWRGPARRGVTLDSFFPAPIVRPSHTYGQTLRTLRRRVTVAGPGCDMAADRRGTVTYFSCGH